MARPFKSKSIRERALRLHLTGMTFAEIGMLRGVSRQMVRKLLLPPIIMRKEVFDRADGKCQECGIKLNNRNAHYHSIPTGSWDDFTQPLVLLCISCHKEIHNQIIGHG